MKPKDWRGVGVVGWLAVIGAFTSLWSQDLASFEARTTVHQLKNGWTFIILERDVAPVFSFATQADVGSAQEAPGITGIAHMFEHMAFKGTPNIGTSDFEAERKALEELEAAYLAHQNERLSLRPDQKTLEELWSAFKEKQEAANQYVVQNEFDDIIKREGGVGLNAGTSYDSTVYFYSLPANKFELFAYLESERFLHPVFREFYQERDVVQEERRLRTESQPIGRLVEQFLATAYIAHPYQQPVIGHMSDLQSFTMTDAEAFFRRYYVPSNLVTAIVGAVKAGEIIPVLEKYFGRIPAGERPPVLRTVEPPQIAEKTVVLRDPAQPFYLEGYHKPAGTHQDQAVYDAIDDILSNGRTSRLYRSLVRDRKVAVVTQSLSSFPGSKYPSLWAVYAVPSRGMTNEQVQEAIRSELDRLKSDLVSDEELARFKTRSRAGLLRSLADNSGLASQLVAYQTLFGDWRELFRYLDKIEKVTREDIRRAAQETFRDANRTIAMIVTEAPRQSSAPDAAVPAR
jgi:predicted Zn-dependent peptidase